MRGDPWTPFGRLVRAIRSRSDDQLAAFDYRDIWVGIQQVYRPFSGIFDHHGSDSWGDHLGIGKQWNDNHVKRRRRRVASWLSHGQTDRWVLAAGLGSPPD